MRRFSTWRSVLVAGVLVVAGVLLLPEMAAACATCFGDPDSPMTKGLNKGILTLLGFIGLVQVGIVRVAWTMRQRSKKLAEASGSDSSSPDK